MQMQRKASPRIGSTRRLPVDRLEELSLMGAHFGCVHVLDKLGVLVNQPRFAQHIRRRIFQLQMTPVSLRGLSSGEPLRRTLLVNCVSIMKL